ncbi:glycosyltransferase family 2 protein [Candidatus Saccharibacteria bacterium]|nr:glycosyltransferase family 2 protein [Candidatus Saccharibacteria bacterium]
MATPRPVTIVIPVYADWPSLKDCLDGLIRTVDLKRHKVILVNDSGPQADLLEKKIQAKVGNRPAFEYYRNPKNLGFVGTCNRAVLELDKTNNDVLLLNSDTKPTAGWLEEMIAVLNISSKNAAVSPRSNNASIATVPLSTAINKGIALKASYAIYQAIKPKLPRYYITPIAHGFCLLLRRSLINRYGMFDPIFGRGYGEEVDWCRRLAAHGYRCLFANRAYIFHLEARGFSAKTKAKLIADHNKIIWRRYPDYRQAVRDWMDKMVPFETSIEKAAGFHAEPKAHGLRGALKRSPPLYRLARGLYRRLKP